MKPSRDFNEPPRSRAKANAERARRSAAVGLVWSWAHDPANAHDPVAAAARVLLEECVRLCDLSPTVERLKADSEVAFAAVNSFRTENARLRRLLHSGEVG